MSRAVSLFLACLFSAVGFAAPAQELLTAPAETVSIPQFNKGTVGKFSQYFQESDLKLSLAEARHTFNTGEVKIGNNNSIALGLGADPVWIKFTVNNTHQLEQAYRLAIETPWLDYIDTWLIKDGHVIKHIQGGDGFAFEKRPMAYRFYAFEFPYQSGQTDIYIRIESKGPMAIPIRFSSIEQAVQNDINNGYQYGLLYGVMLSLALYNLVLFIFIRQREYGLYSFYLLGFILNSLSYTGQLHTMITYDFGPYFQDWLDIFLMITYSVAGLHFARVLLNTVDHAPRLDKFVVRTTLFIPLGMLFGFVIDHLLLSMTLAFLLNTCFVVLFIVMGIKALLAEKPFALIFIFSSVTAALCVTISTLAVLGVIVPYNSFTFKAIEVGMAVEAILLSIILARQFRLAHIGKMIAETYARTDPLTGMNNRRGFQDITQPIWQKVIRELRNVSVVLIDVDSFKNINDQYGHDVGDTVLKEVTKCISATCRKSDISARWGGEEFIVLLPETDQSHAAAQAERIRLAIQNLTINIETLHESISVTASFGVAGTMNNHFNNDKLNLQSLEPMIIQADQALYSAKSRGKNQINSASQYLNPA
jgi:diguanylate cyclase (GGDEF)-like protein